jgi:type I restriction enzyme, S subunit
MSEARWDLPENWEWATAVEIAEIAGGGTPSTSDSSNFTEKGVPWITPADLTGYKETYIGKGRRDLSKKGLQSCGAKLLPAGTVLFSSRAPIGYCAIAANDIATNQGFKSLILRGGISPEYIRHYLLASKDYAESFASGTTFKELSGARAGRLAIPIAPIEEQRRIVTKLDSLLACTDRAREELDRVPLPIDHYKQAILAAAFSGQLTIGQRVALSPAKRSAWRETRLGDLVDDGPTNGWSPPSAPDATGALSLKLTATTRGYFRLDADAVKRIHEIPPANSKYWLEPGDLLIQRANSIEYVGAAAVYDGPRMTYIYPDLMMRIRINNPTLRQFVWRFLNSKAARGYFRENATGTAGNMPKINGQIVRSLPIAVPSDEEQSEIVGCLEEAFSWMDKIALETARAAELLPQLHQAILTKAFRGELVPQDPTDEPAAALLKRIPESGQTGAGRKHGRDRDFLG